MKNCCVLLMLLFLLLPAHFAGATPKKATLPEQATVFGLPVVVTGNKVIVSDESNDGQKHVDLVRDALTPFAMLLRNYPHARTVDLNWFDPVLMGVTGADVLYDRVKHTVTVDYYYGGDDPEYAGKIAFTGVRASVFAALLKAHPKGIPENDPVSEKLARAHGNNASDWGGFQFLYQSRYGCRVRVLRACHKMRLQGHGEG